MFFGLSKRIGGGFRVGVYGRVGRPRMVRVYTAEFCNAFREDLYNDIVVRCSNWGPRKKAIRPFVNFLTFCFFVAILVLICHGGDNLGRTYG